MLHLMFKLTWVQAHDLCLFMYLRWASILHCNIHVLHITVCRLHNSLKNLEADSMYLQDISPVCIALLILQRSREYHSIKISEKKKDKRDVKTKDNNT